MHVCHPVSRHAFRLDAFPQQTILGESFFILPRWPFRRNGRRPPGLQPTPVVRRSWRTPCNCRRLYIALPKPPCRPWPRSLALQSHIGQDRTDQIRPLLSPPITVLPQRRVFGARPAMPRPHGPVCPPDSLTRALFDCSAASHAEGQVYCRMGFDTQILRGQQHAGASPGSLTAPADPCRSIAAKIFGGRAIAAPPRHPPFPHLCKSVRG